jgi:hypothetical protein
VILPAKRLRVKEDEVIEMSQRMGGREISLETPRSCGPIETLEDVISD